ncbi:MAG: hypothetical protein E7402_02915 [Ruminococcaceae bacterium]|nr:hypothetical protein [Oscillospiraceae bacterium]
MIKITRFFYIHWLVLPLLALSYLVGGLYSTFMAYAIVTIHELFHLFAALLLKERIGALVLLPFGMTLRLAARIIRSPGKEIMIAAAGPLANLLMLMLCPLLAGLYGDSLALWQFRLINLFMLFLNCLPCLPLDGGRMVKAFLTILCGYTTAISIMRKLSRLFLVLLFMVAILLLIITKINLSLVIVCSFLALSLIREKQENEYIIMQELLYNKTKLKSRGLMRSRTISALASLPARSLLKRLSYDCYYVIHILNSSQQYLRTVSEAQLVDALLQKGWHISLDDI